MAIAEHHPEEVRPENRGVLKMSHQQLHDFASTPEKGLPHYVGKKKRLRFGGVVFAEKETAPKRRLPRFGPQ